MELINHTPYPAMMFRNALEDDMMAAAALMRVTYDLEGDHANPSPIQPWILHTSPWETPYGPMESDMVFRRGGVDLMVLGKAYAPKGSATRQMEVRIRAGEKFFHTLLVIGDRVWEKNIGGLSISDSMPFTEMPLSLYKAYGGTTDWDGLAFPYGNNPFGKGFYWEKENAVGQALPNIENPKHRIQKWDDRPDPVGFVACPMNELRMRKNVEYTEDGQITKLHPRFFNAAFPDMVADAISPGMRISIEGMSQSGIFEFDIPAHHLKLQIRMGDKLTVNQMHIDQICIIPDDRQLYITYRFPFRYQLRAMEKRTCEISENQ